MYKLQPLPVPRKDGGQGRIVAQRREQPEKTKSGLIIPEIYRDENKPSEADVVSVSDGCNYLTVGDHIIFNQYTGCEVLLGGQYYLVMREEDVLARIVQVPDDDGGE